jgi:hypothetical protein
MPAPYPEEIVSVNTRGQPPSIDRREFAVRFLKVAALLALPPGAFSAIEAGSYDVIVLRDIQVRMPSCSRPISTCLPVEPRQSLRGCR